MNTALRSALLSLTIAVVAAAGPAQATIIYDNGPLALGGANEIGVESDVRSGWQLADDFVLTSALTINRIVWWGSNTATSDFGIQFFDDAGGRPADDAFLSLAFDDVVPSVTDFPDPFQETFEYAVDVAPISLELGVSYWISIFGTSLDRSWFWSSAGLGNLHERHESFSPEWQMHPFAHSDLGFRLVHVPEPSTLLLMMAGLLVSLDVQRRRRSS